MPPRAPVTVLLTIPKLYSFTANATAMPVSADGIIVILWLPGCSGRGCRPQPSNAPSSFARHHRLLLGADLLCPALVDRWEKHQRYHRSHKRADDLRDNESRNMVHGDAGERCGEAAGERHRGVGE